MNSRLNRVQNWPELAQQAEWTAVALAQRCGVSLRTLERYFLHHTGKSPVRWLFEQRQLVAVQLLLGNCTVKETAASLGYSKANNFSRDFKRFWGCSPTMYAGKVSGLNQFASQAVLESERIPV